MLDPIDRAILELLQANARISNAEPATCGDDIEVPAIAWNISPGGPPTMSSRNGV